MARRRYGRRRGRKAFKVPIITLGILGGQAALAGAFSGGSIANTLDNFQSFYTGFQMLGDQQFHGEKLLVGYGPWLAKGLVMKVARPMGAVPRMPFGLPISFS